MGFREHVFTADAAAIANADIRYTDEFAARTERAWFPRISDVTLYHKQQIRLQLEARRSHSPRGAVGEHDHILRPIDRTFVRPGKADVNQFPRKLCMLGRRPRHFRSDLFYHRASSAGDEQVCGADTVLSGRRPRNIFDRRGVVS